MGFIYWTGQYGFTNTESREKLTFPEHLCLSALHFIQQALCPLPVYFLSPTGPGTSKVKFPQKRSTEIKYYHPLWKKLFLYKLPYTSFFIIFHSLSRLTKHTYRNKLNSYWIPHEYYSTYLLNYNLLNKLACQLVSTSLDPNTSNQYIIIYW